ncbi:hypothetical protein [Thalassospira xiamenensis]|uniref:Intein C-terminal splicing region n=1 Tax=Thalassospira xiamenensis TaxID=220697 RepID=A0A285TI80_9PROT|nr:hypothetical protein [Thalassospira xiamenensis]SOC21694.1 intein C-terminal splicing region [Thalassospira xiamenensis]
MTLELTKRGGQGSHSRAPTLPHSLADFVWPAQTRPEVSLSRTDNHWVLETSVEHQFRLGRFVGFAARAAGSAALIPNTDHHMKQLIWLSAAMPVTCSDGIMPEFTLPSAEGLRNEVALLPKRHCKFAALYRLCDERERNILTGYVLQEARHMSVDVSAQGNAQPLDAKVLTPRGWMAMSDMRIGQQVIGSNGLPTLVTGVYPKGPRDVYRVTFSDGASTECCDEHLWDVNTPYRRAANKVSRVLSLKQVMDNLFDNADNPRHSIPIMAAAHFDVKDINEGSSYQLGLLLAGATSPGKMAKIEAANLFEQHTNLKFRPGIWSALSPDIGLPADSLRIPIKSRISLLQGLMDIAGLVEDTGAVEFATGSKRMSESVTTLVRSLGGTAKATFNTTRFLNSETDGHHIVSLCLPRDVVPFSEPERCERWTAAAKYNEPVRTIESIEYIGQKRCQCISVAASDHLYVTNDFIVTHNTVRKHEAF